MLTKVIQIRYFALIYVIATDVDGLNDPIGIRTKCVSH